jgi:PAS domain S-box-containing protein
VDREIEDALRRVCELLHLDVAVLWQWSAGSPDVIVPTHAHPPRKDPGAFEPLSQEAFPWVVAEMRAGRMVVLPSLEALPPEAAADRESARLTGIFSNLTLPLAVGGEPPVGALAFNSLRAERDWPDALVNRLQLVAQVFTNALTRKRAEQALRESEELSRATFEQAAVGIAHVGLDGRWLRVNDKLCDIVGYGREELLRRTFQEVTHPADLEADLDLVSQVLAGAIRTYSMEKRYVRRDGSLVWANLTVSLARNEAGEPRHFISVLEDITERRRGEEALRSNEGRLAAAAALAGLGFYEIDYVDKTIFADDRLLDLCGVPADRTAGLEARAFWLEHIHPDDLPRVLELQAQLHGGREGRVSAVYRYRHPARGLRWIQHLTDARARDASGRTIRTYGVARDITEEKRAEAALKELSRRLLEAHEAERALLARELHDDLSQRLALLAIEAGRAERAALGGRAEETLRSIRQGLVRLSEDVHALAYQLHPSVLEELGLAEALRTECERRRRQGGFQVALSADERTDVGPETALCLFRVAQEALNNVARHAGARTVTVDLRRMEGGLLLAVRDDGVGFDPAAPRAGRSLGLASMRERVHLVGGSLDVESAPGEGTAVVAWVPGTPEPA